MADDLIASPAPMDAAATPPPSPPSDIYAQVESAHGLPSGLLRAVETTESRGNPNAISPTGVRGNMQITGATWKDYADPGEPYSTDPDRQREIAARILKDRIARNGGDVRRGVAAYGDPNQSNYADLVFNNWSNPQTSMTPGTTGRRATVKGPDGRSATINIPDGAGDDEIQQAIDAVVAHMQPTQTSGGPQPAVAGDTGNTAMETPAPQPAPTSPTLPVEQPWRDVPVDQAGMEMNTAMGLKPDHPYGKYAAAIGKPAADALTDVYNAFTAKPGQTGDPLSLSTWMDAGRRALDILKPLAVPGEIAGNVVFQGLTDAGASPEVAGALATIVSLGVGAKTPIPGVTPGEVPAMPFQGTTASRAAAAEATGAATQAEQAVHAATTTGEDAVRAAQTTTADVAARGEAATTQADTLANQARATADDAARQAEEAKSLASASPAARARVEAELTPGGTTPAEGSTAAAGALERELGDVKDPVQGIYNTLIESAQAQGKRLSPENAEELLHQVDAITEELGPTLTGQSKGVIDEVRAALEGEGELPDAKLLDAYKQQLDTLFPGRTKPNMTPRDRAMYDFKWRVRDMMRSMFDDNEQEWAGAADSLYRDVIIGKDSPEALGNLAKLAKKNPATFVERIFGNGRTDKAAQYAQAVMKHLDDATATKLRESVLSRAMDTATDQTTGNLDPKKLLTTVGKYNRGFYDAMVPPNVQTFFKLLQKEQGAVAETAETATRGAQWATAAEREAASVGKQATKEAGAATKATEKATSDAASTVKAAERDAAKARTAADTATEAAKEPNKLAKMTALGLEIGIPAAARLMGGPIAGEIAAGVMGTGRLAGLLIPRASLARALADSPTANLLVRAIRAPETSKAAGTIIEELRDRDRSVNFLGKREEKK